MRQIISLIAFFCLTLTVFSQDQISLDGSWQIIYDDNDDGVKNEWYLDENYDAHPNVEQINVPSCWEEYKKIRRQF